MPKSLNQMGKLEQTVGGMFQELITDFFDERWLDAIEELIPADELDIEDDDEIDQIYERAEKTVAARLGKALLNWAENVSDDVVMASLTEMGVPTFTRLSPS